MPKETSVAYFKVLSQNFHPVSEKYLIVTREK
jgi:hypothetical protein